MKQPHEVKCSREEGEALIGRVYASDLPCADCRVLAQIIRLHFWLMLAMQEAKLSLKRLRQILFGESAQGRSESVPEPSAEAAKGERDASPALDKDREGHAPRERGSHRPGQGRLGADAYVGAERMACRHEDLAPGDRCPVCGQGTLYSLPAGVEIRTDSNALLSAMRYALEKLRCSACGAVFKDRQNKAHFSAVPSGGQP